MSALAHYIESEGVATTGVSLVRPHTEMLRPPRFLWVPFPLGRPLGTPNAPDFQRRVLLAALALLEAEDGPVLLADFDEDAPDAGVVAESAAVCPVGFPPPRPSGMSDLGARLIEEVRALAPWYEIGAARRGRSLFGLSGTSPEGVARLLGEATAGILPEPREGRSTAQALKLASEDLKAYYREAVTAQPGHRDAEAVERWFWTETAAGEAFRRLQRICTASDDEETRYLGQRSFVPRAHAIGPN